MSAKWEYCVIAVSIDASTDIYKDTLQNSLNEMGNKGWELVTVAPRTTVANDGFPFVAILKRPQK
jgi:hypothetical protein